MQGLYPMGPEQVLTDEEARRLTRFSDTSSRLSCYPLLGTLRCDPIQAIIDPEVPPHTQRNHPGRLQFYF